MKLYDFFDAQNSIVTPSLGAHCVTGFCALQRFSCWKWLVQGSCTINDIAYIIKIGLVIAPETRGALEAPDILVAKLQARLVTRAPTRVTCVQAVLGAETLDQADVVPEFVECVDTVLDEGDLLTIEGLAGLEHGAGKV